MLAAQLLEQHVLRRSRAAVADSLRWFSAETREPAAPSSTPLPPPSDPSPAASATTPASTPQEDAADFSWQGPEAIGEATATYLTPADVKSEAKQARSIALMAKEDFNQFYLRNSKLFPLTRKKSAEEHRALLLAARRKFDMSFDILAELGPETVDSAFRALLAQRKHVRGKAAAPDAKGLEVLEKSFARVKFANAAVVGLMIETHMRARNFDRALQLCKDAAAFSGEERVTLFNAMLFEISENGCPMPAEQVLRAMGEARVAPTLETFSLFLKACAREAEPLLLAQRTMREMARIGMQPVAATFLALAEVLPAIRSASDQHSLAHSILGALAAQPQLAISDRETSQRLHIVLAGHAKAVNDPDLLCDVYHSACTHNPTLAGNGTAIDDPFFWECMMGLVTSREYADEVLEWYVQMPPSAKLMDTTYRRLLREAFFRKHFICAVRALKDVSDVYNPRGLQNIFETAAATVLQVVRQPSFDLASSATRLEAYNALETLVKMMLQREISVGADHVIFSLLHLGLEAEAVQALQKVSETTRVGVLQAVRHKGPADVAARLIQRFGEVPEGEGMDSFARARNFRMGRGGDGR